MSQDDLSTTQALRLLGQEARKQLVRWAADVSIDGMALARKAPWRLTMSLVSGCLLAVFGVAMLIDDDSRRSHGAGPGHAVKRLQDVQSRAAPSPRTNTAQAIRWEGRELVVVLDQMPLAQAIAQLSAATGAVVSGSHLLQASVHVTLHLRTHDVNVAWQRLLDRVATFSMSCAASNCQVWIRGEISQPITPADPRMEGATLESEREQRRGVTSEELASQPDGSC
jgi:hypothetical protein